MPSILINSRKREFLINPFQSDLAHSSVSTRPEGDHSINKTDPHSFSTTRDFPDLTSSSGGKYEKAERTSRLLYLSPSYEDTLSMFDLVSLGATNLSAGLISPTRREEKNITPSIYTYVLFVSHAYAVCPWTQAENILLFGSNFEACSARKISAIYIFFHSILRFIMRHIFYSGLMSPFFVCFCLHYLQENVGVMTPSCPSRLKCKLCQSSINKLPNQIWKSISLSEYLSRQPSRRIYCPPPGPYIRS